MLMDAVYQPYHIRVYQVVKKAFKVALKADEAETALTYGGRCLVGLRAHLDVCDRLLGYNLWRVGQLQAKLGLNLKAHHTLTEALPTLRLAYGVDHVMTGQAQRLLCRLSAGKDTAGIVAGISHG